MLLESGQIYEITMMFQVGVVYYGLYLHTTNGNKLWFLWVHNGKIEPIITTSIKSFKKSILLNSDRILVT